MAGYVRPELIQSIHSYMQDGNRTNKRHARYGQLYLGTSGQLVGGIQTYHNRETNGTHLEPEGGSDWNETVVGQRQFSITCRRQCVRGSDIPQMVRLEYGGAVQDVDFRDLPFMLAYMYNFQSATGKQQFEVSNWQWAGVTIADYDQGYDSPTGLIMESFTAISQGYIFTDVTGKGAQSRGMPAALMSGIGY